MNRKGACFRLTALLCLLVFPAVVCASEETKSADCLESQTKGRLDASVEHGSGGWFAGGLASGFVLGLIGTGIITAIAANSNPQPMLIPDDVIKSCYIDGYKGKAKSKNTWTALGGGLVGTAVLVLIYVSVSD